MKINKTFILLFVVILLVGCNNPDSINNNSNIDSNIDSFNTDVENFIKQNKNKNKKDIDSQIELFRKLYPDNLATDVNIDICKQLQSGKTINDIAKQRVDKIKSLVENGTISHYQYRDAVVNETVMFILSRQNCVSKK